jgi:nucleoside-diphosphate-sugar epimerase
MHLKQSICIVTGAARGIGRALAEQLLNEGACVIASDVDASTGTYPNTQLKLYPDTLTDEVSKIPATLPVLRGSHEANWVEACKGEVPISSDFTYAAGLTELTHLGNLAIRLGGRIEWGTAACRSTNRPEAADLVKMPRRAEWELG